ncbi:MAG: hypothetical protein ACFFA6_10510 [Promethearchaeota archaeon]
MPVSLNVKQEFLDNFQKNIIQGRRLLQNANHLWADRLLTDLFYKIEKTEWLDIQKKHQLIMVISNSWWIYLNSLIKSDKEVDLIRYIDGYKRFFSFLSKIDDFYLFDNFCTNLLKSFITLGELSQSGITKYINSFSIKLKERGEYLKLIELQIILMYLRKSVIPSEYFHFGMEILGRTLFKIEPGKRSLFLYIFLENICLKYQLMEDSAEFVRIINKILINRLPAYLKNEFSNISRISINERSFSTILVDLEELIYYLNNIGEYLWIMIIIRNVFYKIREYQSFGDAVTYIRKYIDFSINRNRFEIAYNIYDFLEDLFMFQTDLSYDNILIELWVEACKKFVDMKEKRYLLQALEKLNTHLKMPQTSAQIFHYFYTSNLLWKFKSMFFSLEQRDFWRMMFYRALFEEKNFSLAQKILLYLDEKFNQLITNLVALYDESEPLKKEIYSFEDEDKSIPTYLKDFVIKQIIIRIDSKGVISYRMISLDNQIVEGTILTEFWNDTQILEIFNELFSESEDKKYVFNLTEYGQLFFIFLPKLVRDLFESFKIQSLNIVPQIYFILDNMTIPFDLIYDNNFFLLKYSTGYKIGEAPLGGIAFEQDGEVELESETLKKIYNVLIIETINSMSPKRWNEQTKNKELIFPFPAGANELNYIINFLNERDEINQITTLVGANSTRETILSHISEGAYHLIIFVGNIFYSKWSPKDSFFITNDETIVTINEIKTSLNQNRANLQPLLFFNAQIYNVKGIKLTNVLRKIGEILAQFDYDRITGIISRNYPIFNDEANEIIANFFTYLLKGDSQGIALLTARQQCISEKMIKLVEQQFTDLTADDGSKHIDLESSLALSSYILFGKPWKKLIF